jgi:hypothetical protein
MEIFLVILFFVIFGIIYEHFNKKTKEEYKRKKNQERAIAAQLKKKEDTNLSGYTSPSKIKSEAPPQTANKSNKNATRQQSASFKQTKSDFSKDRPEQDVLKNRGDGYELHIGRKFELKGDLVIYNGFIQGYADQGVDIVVLPRNIESIYLIQCKHWRKMEFTRAQLDKIYDKLDGYLPDYQYILPEQINEYLSVKKSDAEITTAINKSLHYDQVRKTLYLSSKYVIQDEVWALLEPIKDNIFRYKDLKVVVYAI